MHRRLGWLLAGAAMAAPLPALAQAAVEGRVSRLESEMRAVQRKIFPDGAGRMITPDISPPDQAQSIPGSPASGAMADLTSRVDALEQQQQALTGQIEQLQYRTRQLEDAFTAYKKSTDARLEAPQDNRASGGASPPPPAAVDPSSDGDQPPRLAPTKTAPRPAGGLPYSGVDAAAGDLQKPSTGDPGEDAYLYGYRLWMAKRYPEAEAQLKAVVAKYPQHKRASYAQNLLGRAYLDDGKTNTAATAFYDNYKKMPDGERAPDSLFFLAQSLMQLKKPTDACKVYGELSDVYGDKMGADLKAKVASGRSAAKCQ